MFAVNVSCFVDEMDCGVEQIDGPSRTRSPSCEQRDAGREGEKDADARQRGDLCRPRIKLPQRSDMICGFASLKGQRIRKFACFIFFGIKIWKSVFSPMSKEQTQHRGFAWTNSWPRQYVWAENMVLNAFGWSVVLALTLEGAFLHCFISPSFRNSSHAEHQKRILVYPRT